MVRAWYMDSDTTSDQRLEHHKNPPEYITIEDVNKLSGVEYFYINPETIDEDGKIEKIKKERGYSYEDQLTCSKECLENYEQKLKIFYSEHLHTDEEIRLIIDGSGYFDVRDKNDDWIRIEVTAGDMLVLPGGIYHRFTLDTKNYLQAKRFFIGEPVWTSYNRQESADQMECRKNYVNELQNKNVLINKDM